MLSDHPTIALDPIPGYPGYLVSRLGGVFTTLVPGRKYDPARQSLARPMSPTPSKTGDYLTVILCIKNKHTLKKVHSLVLETYVGPRPEGMECLHGPGGKHDNSIGNLRWGTSQENSKDRDKDGQTCRGTDHHNAKLSPDDIRKIREMNAREAAQKYGINGSHARRIKKRISWSHID